RAEQFRKMFHNPGLIEQMLKDWSVNPKLVAFPSIQPPDVTLRAGSEVVKDRDLEVTLRAVPRRLGGKKENDLSPVPRAPEANRELRSVILWVNDYRFAEWTEEELDLDKNGAFNKRLTIPRDKLRRATNLLTLQCYNRGDVRGEAKPVKVYCERPRGPVNLYG